VYYGHKAVKYRSMLKAWGGPWIVSFHGVDVAKFFDRPGYAAKMAKVFAEAELVLGRSESLLQRLRELGCPPEKLRLNPTPIPLDGFEIPERPEPENGAFRLVQASRLIAKKGLFTTLEALKSVTREFPAAKFILCGDGPDRESFAKAVAEAGLSGNVELLGWLDQESLRREYARAHLFLHPSEMTANSDQEGVPNSMLEAMATGLPVVATWHGGIPEAVRDGEDGRLVPEKDPAALAKAILELLRDSTERNRCGANAAASVRATYGLEASLRRLEDCYREAIVSAEARREKGHPGRS
jgi:glycosyltransferase involved in cell wall biosynthesis